MLIKHLTYEAFRDFALSKKLLNPKEVAEVAQAIHDFDIALMGMEDHKGQFVNIKV